MSNMKAKQYARKVEQIKKELNSKDFDENFVNRASIQILKEIGKDRRSRQMNYPGQKWREDEATEKQLKVLEKYDIDYSSDITKGEASDIIQNLISKDEDKKIEIEED